MQGSIPLASRTSCISTIRKAKPTYLSTLRSMRRLRPGLSASDQKARGLVQAEGASPGVGTHQLAGRREFQGGHEAQHRRHLVGREGSTAGIEQVVLDGIRGFR